MEKSLIVPWTICLLVCFCVVPEKRYRGRSLGICITFLIFRKKKCPFSTPATSNIYNIIKFCGRSGFILSEKSLHHLPSVSSEIRKPPISSKIGKGRNCPPQKRIPIPSIWSALCIFVILNVVQRICCILVMICWLSFFFIFHQLL